MRPCVTLSASFSCPITSSHDVLKFRLSPCIVLYRLSMGWYTVSPAPVWARIQGPQTRVRGEAEYPGGGIPGSVFILGQVTQFWQNILDLYNSTGFWKLFWHQQCTVSGIVYQKEVAVKSSGLWSGAPHTTHYYVNHYYWCIQWH